MKSLIVLTLVHVLIFHCVVAIRSNELLEYYQQDEFLSMQVNFAGSLAEMLDVLDATDSLESIQQHIQQSMVLAVDGSEHLINYAYDYLVSFSLQSYSLKRYILREIWQVSQYGYTSKEAYTLLIDLMHVQHDSCKLKIVNSLLRDSLFLRAVAESIETEHVEMTSAHHNLTQYENQVSVYFESFDDCAKLNRSVALISLLCQLGSQYADIDGLSSLSLEDTIVWNGIKEFMTGKLVSLLVIESSDAQYKCTVLEHLLKSTQRLRPVYDCIDGKLANDVFSNDFYCEMMEQVYELSDVFGLLDFGEDKEDLDWLTHGFLEMYQIYQYIRTFGRRALPEWGSFVVLRYDSCLGLLLMDHLIAVLNLDFDEFYQRSPRASRIMAKHLCNSIVMPMARLSNCALAFVDLSTVSDQLKRDLMTNRVGQFLELVSYM